MRLTVPLGILHRTVNGCADPMWIWLGKACCILEQCTSSVQPQGIFPTFAGRTTRLTTYKAEYAATILLFFSLGFSKLAIVAFLYGLDPPRLRRKLNHGVGVLVCSWTLCASLVAAFQCRLPRPWDRTLKQCLNRVRYITNSARRRSKTHSSHGGMQQQFSTSSRSLQQ
jgi:hypothetical protein